MAEQGTRPDIDRKVETADRRMQRAYAEAAERHGGDKASIPPRTVDRIEARYARDLREAHGVDEWGKPTPEEARRRRAAREAAAATAAEPVMPDA